MGFNYRTEKKKFDAQWEQLWAEYRAAGMDELSIAEMYAYDLSVFNQRRIIAHREQPLTADVTGEHEDESTLFYKFMDQLSCQDCYCYGTQRFAWIEQIRDETLYERILALPEQDKELLTMLAIDGYTQGEIAKIRHRGKSAICRKLWRLAAYLYAV